MASTGNPDIAALRDRPWDASDFTYPAEILDVPGMLSDSEKRMLFHLAASYYTGEGAIADMGAYLGGSTICFAAGLAAKGVDRPVLHSYDLFLLSDFELQRDFADHAPEGNRTRALFEHNLREHRHLLEVHEGDLLAFPWTHGPLELLFVDIAKSYRTFDHIVASYFPALIPGRSLVILQDYILSNSGPWHHVVMEKLAGYFEYVVDTRINSAVFLNTERIPEEALRAAAWEAIPADEKLVLMDQAIERFDDEVKRGHLQGSRQLLAEGKDMYWGMVYHRLADEAEGR